MCPVLTWRVRYAVLGVYRIHLEEIITTAAVSTVVIFTLVHTVTNRNALVYIIASALVDIQPIPFVTITGERARCVDAELFASSKTTV